MNAVKMNLQKFYKFCEWLKKQPQPVLMSYQQVVDAYFADTGELISTSTVRKGSESTGIIIRRPSQMKAERAAGGANRVSNMAGVLRRFTLAVESKLKCPLMTEEDKKFLELVNGCLKTTTE